MKKINLSKVILKLECLFHLNIYILFYLILYSKSHFDSNKSKKRSNRKKITPYVYIFTLQPSVRKISKNNGAIRLSQILNLGPIKRSLKYLPGNKNKTL